MAERSPSDAAEQISDDAEIARPPLNETIANHIRELIIRGEMPPGAKINLPALAIALGVSTTPVREALKILGEEEIVEWLPGRGVRVAPLRAEQTGAHFEVIAVLEALAAEQAVVRMGEAELAELEAVHTDMRGHFERGERDPYFELNSRIHDHILKFSDQRRLASPPTPVSMVAPAAVAISPSSTMRVGARRCRNMKI